MTGIHRLLAHIRYRIAWWRWFLGNDGIPLGDPSLGKGEERRANIRLLMERWQAKEPKP